MKTAFSSWHSAHTNVYLKLAVFIYSKTHAKTILQEEFPFCAVNFPLEYTAFRLLFTPSLGNNIC